MQLDLKIFIFLYYINIVYAQIILKSNDSLIGGTYGSSCAISNNFIVIGAPTRQQGAIYIYKENNNNEWIQQHKIIPYNISKDSKFGKNVAISLYNDIISVSSPFEDNIGIVYTYSYNNMTNEWMEYKINSSDANPYDSFGHSISISDDYLVIGAPSQNSSRGAVYLYTLNNWILDKKFIASDNHRNDGFGTSVSISLNNQFIAVGTPYKNNTKGGVYIYHHNATMNEWIEQKIHPTDGIEHDYFGGSVSVSNDGYLFVGERAGSIGVVFETIPQLVIALHEKELSGPIGFALLISIVQLCIAISKYVWICILHRKKENKNINRIKSSLDENEQIPYIELIGDENE